MKTFCRWEGVVRSCCGGVLQEVLWKSIVGKSCEERECCRKRVGIAEKRLPTWWSFADVSFAKTCC